ncbi:MAG: hypothetical protein IAC54_00610 [Bacteroidetes bacterium]|uniref:Cell division protein FtsQ n=1 Tax=Candidatus Caccoplasma merdipullorum TaxID=2840718 RepID=A0A9D9E0P2_9BACT|nr:hypothetical protein [Candidatus Caccoplasma merdipullorum]
MKRFFRIFFLSLMPAYLIAALVYCDIAFAREVCTDVEVAVLDSASVSFLAPADILEIVNSSGLSPVGKKRVDFDADSVEKQIKGNPVVETAECYVTASGKVRIDVTQRVPLLRVISPTGSYYVDTNARIMPLSKWVTAYLPVATGHISREYACNELFRLAGFLDSDNKWGVQIAQIYVTASQDIELIPRIGRQLIVFGKISNFERKFKLLDELYSQAFSKTGWDTYGKIDLTYDGRIICTRRVNDKNGN